MRTTIETRALVVGAALFLTSCATTTRPQQFRTSFVPPAQAISVTTDDPVLEPPQITQNLYANEMPGLTLAFPDVAKPSDVDFLLKKADDRFAAGKRATLDNRPDDARREFNGALQVLLTAPDNVADRGRVERRIEELVEAIYRYDLDQLGARDREDKVTYDKAPKDDILEMTFPMDPGLRNKVKEQIQATKSQLPLEESDAVVGAIHFFSTERGKKIIASGLRRAGRYKTLIEKVLAEEGLPQELIFVAQAESGFSPRAMSNKACVGLWQFAKFRGNEYGLRQTPATDERMDPEKATRAAARHLHDLYTHFGDWYLALAAYDCGPGCVDKAVMRTGYADFWQLRRLNVLPKETANYVPVILAMTIMSKNAGDYGLDNLDLERPLEFDTLELQSPTHISLVADAVDHPLSELRELNPALLRSVAPAGYALHVPKGSLSALESAFAVVPPNRRDSWRLHRMAAGETVAAVAKRYGSSSAMVSSANREEPEPGQFMAIPVAYPGDRVSVKAKPAAPAKHAAARKPTTRRKPATTQAKSAVPRKRTSSASLAASN